MQSNFSENGLRKLKPRTRTDFHDARNRHGTGTISKHVRLCTHNIELVSLMPSSDDNSIQLNLYITDHLHQGRYLQLNNGG